MHLLKETEEIRVLGNDFCSDYEYSIAFITMTPWSHEISVNTNVFNFDFLNEKGNADNHFQVYHEKQLDSFTNLSVILTDVETREEFSFVACETTLATSNKYWIMALDDQNSFTTVIHPVSRIYVLFPLTKVNLLNEKNIKNLSINLYKTFDIKLLRNQLNLAPMLSELNQQYNQTNETSSYRTETVATNSKPIASICRQSSDLTSTLSATMKTAFIKKDKIIVRTRTANDIKEEGGGNMTKNNDFFSDKITSTKEIELIPQLKQGYLRRSPLQPTRENVIYVLQNLPPLSSYEFLNAFGIPTKDQTPEQQRCYKLLVPLIKTHAKITEIAEGKKVFIENLK
jgi:hypothetical protein